MNLSPKFTIILITLAGVTFGGNLRADSEPITGSDSDRAAAGSAATEFIAKKPFLKAADREGAGEGKRPDAKPEGDLQKSLKEVADAAKAAAAAGAGGKDSKEAKARLEAAVAKARAEAQKVADEKAKKEPPKAADKAAEKAKAELAARAALVAKAAAAKAKTQGPPEGASFHVDPEAGQLLERAREFLADGRPEFSVEVWREVLRKYGSTLTTRKDWVQKGPLSKGEYRLYHRLREDVEKEIAEQKPSVLKSFRIHADAEAKALLFGEAGSREAALSAVVDRFFLSDLGDDAAFELACFRLERWDFDGALGLLRMVQEEHPDPSVPRGEILLRVAVAAAGVGDVERAESVIAELVSPEGVALRSEISAPALREVTAFVRDRVEAGIAPVVSTSISQSATLSPPADALEEGLSEGWNVGPRPPAAGSDKSSTTNVGNGSVVIRGGGVVVINGVVVSNTGANKDAAMLQNWRKMKLRPTNQLTISGERVYLMVEGRLTCVDAATGKLFWRGLRPKDLNPSDPRHSATIRLQNSSLNAFQDHLAHQLAVIGDSVYALERFVSDPVTPKPGVARVVIRRGSAGQRLSNVLAVYDKMSGNERWRRRPTEKDFGRSETPVDAAAFLSSPIPHGDHLLIPASEDGRLSLLALDPVNGKTIWKTFLCQEPGNSTKPGSTVAVAADGDDLFVNSGSGALFCLDSHSGHIRWGMRYPRSGTQAQHWSTPSKVAGFEDNRLFIDGARVIVVPSDFNYVFAISRTTGKIHWEIPNGSNPEKAASYLIAAADNRIYLGGAGQIYCYSAENGKRLWERPLPDTSFGRALLAGESIFVPHEGKIRRIDTKNGKIVEEQWAVFPEPTPVGNLATDGKRLLAAGMKRGYSLSPLEDAMRALAQRIEEGDPGAYQARMRLYIQKGEVEKAVDDLVALTKTLQAQKDFAEAGSRFYDGLEELELATRDASLELVLQLIAQEADAAGDAKIEKKDADAITERRYATLRIALDRVAEKGGASPETILDIAPFLDREDLLYLGRRAIAKVAKGEAGELLEASLIDGGRTAVVAFAGLAKLRGKAAVEEIAALMRTGDDHTRLYAAAELLNFDRPEALEEIVALLDSKDKTVRRLAGGWLRHLTSGEIIFYADAPDTVRNESRAEVERWLGDSPALGDLALPFDLRPQFAGRILAVSYDNTRRMSIISELQPDGKHVEIVRTPITQRIMDVQGLPNGNVLAVAYNRITEFDISGKAVWDLPLPTTQRVVKARRLPNGNTVAMDYKGAIREYEKGTKKIAKTWRKAGQSGDKFSLMENGNILIFSTRRKDVVEMDPTGKEVRTTTIPGLPAGKAVGTYITAASTNSEGVVVVSDVRKRRLVAFAADTGKELWIAENINYAREIQPLPGGNFLIVQSNAIHEITGEGKMVEGTKISGTFYGAHKF